MIRLGLRLALAADGRARAVAAVTTAAVAVATALLLLALSVAPALQHQADRTAWTDPPSSSTGLVLDGGPGPATWMSPASDVIGSRVASLVRVAPDRPGAPVPPGLPALPGPGEAYLSPALARLVAADPVLAGRYGRVRGTVGDEALAGPQALVAVQGADLRQVRAEMGIRMTSFSRTGDALELTPAMRLLLLVGAAGVLLPIGYLVAVITRLTAAARERRLAALRLAGATRGQLARLAAVEALVPGVLGALGGVLLAAALRPWAARTLYLGEPWFPADLSPGPLVGPLALVAVVALTVAGARLGMRRVASSPLGVARRETARPARARRLLPLAACLAGGAAALVALPRTGLVVLAVFAALLLAVLVAGPFLTRVLGLGLARSGRPALLLAGRRLADDPQGGFRPVAGVVLAVGALTTFLALTPAAAESVRSTAVIGQQAGTGRADLTYTSTRQGQQVLAAVRRIDGIEDAVLARTAMVSRPPEPASIWIGDCAQIVRAARLPGVPCGRAPVVLADGGPLPAQEVAAGVELDSFETGEPGDQLPPPDRPPVLRSASVATMPRQTGVDAPEVIAEPGAVHAPGLRFRPTLLLFRYRDTVALERARTAVVAAGTGATVVTRESSLEGYNGDTRRLYRIVRVVTALVFLVAGCSLLVAVAVGLLERRRPFALLRACGVPLQTLRGTVLAEAAAPLLLASTLTALLGAAAGALAVGGQGRHTFPVGQVALVCGAATAGTLLVVALALPLVGRLLGPAELRAE